MNTIKLLFCTALLLAGITWQGTASAQSDAGAYTKKGADTCLEWSPVTSCTGGTFCDQGNCVKSCSDACATSGAVLCTTDNSGTQTCGNFDADSCLDLSSAVPCPSNHACSNGTCVPTCLDECQLTDAARCSAVGQAVERCGNFDADGCLEFGGAQDCTGGATCTNGS